MTETPAAFPSLRSLSLTTSSQTCLTPGTVRNPAPSLRRDLLVSWLSSLDFPDGTERMKPSWRAKSLLGKRYPERFAEGVPSSLSPEGYSLGEGCRADARRSGAGLLSPEFAVTAVSLGPS